MRRGTIRGVAALTLTITTIGLATLPADASAPRDNPTTSAAAPASEAHAVNNRGEVVGWSSTTAGTQHAVRWPTYGSRHLDAEDLGTLGGANSWAYGVNDLGAVAGVSEDARGAWRAFLWTPANGGRMTKLKDLPGAVGCEAQDINDRGQVVGDCTVPDGTGFYVQRPVLWSGGAAIELDSGPRTVRGFARGINDRGEVVGTLFPGGNEELVLWAGGSRIRLDSTRTFSAGDVNDRGEVVGNDIDSNHGRLYTPTTAAGDYQTTDLGALAGDYSEVYDINERGEAVGSSNTADAIRGFVWDRGTMTDIGTLGGTNSWAYGINDRGEVVGQSHLSSLERRAFIWSRGSMTDLGTLR